MAGGAMLSMPVSATGYEPEHDLELVWTLSALPAKLLAVWLQCGGAGALQLPGAHALSGRIEMRLLLWHSCWRPQVPAAGGPGSLLAWRA